MLKGKQVSYIPKSRRADDMNETMEAITGLFGYNQAWRGRSLASELVARTHFGRETLKIHLNIMVQLGVLELKIVPRQRYASAGSGYQLDPYESWTLLKPEAVFVFSDTQDAVVLFGEGS